MAEDRRRALGQWQLLDRSTMWCRIDALVSAVDGLNDSDASLGTTLLVAGTVVVAGPVALQVPDGGLIPFGTATRGAGYEHLVQVFD